MGALKHLEKEAREAQESVGEANTLPISADAAVEIVDCLFLTFDAARRAGMTLDSLLDGAFAKLEINKKRKWNAPVEGQPCEHVREGDNR